MDTGYITRKAETAMMTKFEAMEVDDQDKYLAEHSPGDLPAVGSLIRRCSAFQSKSERLFTLLSIRLHDGSYGTGQFSWEKTTYRAVLLDAQGQLYPVWCSALDWLRSYEVVS